MKLSIALPTYDCNGKGLEFLKFQLNQYSAQTFKDFEIVVSDHSEIHERSIEDFCIENIHNLDIKYVRNEHHRGNFTPNLNNAMRHCNGEIIKILLFDDQLWDQNSLQKTVDAFTPKTNWLVSATEHTRDGVTFFRPFYPRYHDMIWTGDNTISSPSVMSVRRNVVDGFLTTPLFDERLVWLMDVDYYETLYNIFGEPTVLNDITVVIRQWEGQVSNKITQQTKDYERSIVEKKHGKPKPK